MSCKYCTPRDDTDLCGEYVFTNEDTLDSNSHGRFAIWHDEDIGYSFTILVHDGDVGRTGAMQVKLPHCPFCGRRLT